MIARGRGVALSAPGRSRCSRYRHLPLARAPRASPRGRATARPPRPGRARRRDVRRPAAPAGSVAGGDRPLLGRLHPAGAQPPHATRRAPRSASSPSRPRCSADRRRERPRSCRSRRSARCTARPPGAALEAAGATVRARTRVAALEDDAVVLADGERVAGGRVRRRAPAGRDRAALLGEPAPALEDSPIVSVHLLFDRSAPEPPLAALLGSPAHWVFDRGRAHRTPARARSVPDRRLERRAGARSSCAAASSSSSCAGELTERLGPAELLWSRVSREPAATFAARPGDRPAAARASRRRPERRRAPARGRDTGWPATMEGAVRSGRAAAARLLAPRVRAMTVAA